MGQVCPIRAADGTICVHRIRCAGLGAGAGCGGYLVPLGGGGAAGQVCPLRTADGAIVVSILLGALLGAGAGGTCGRGSVPLLAAGGRGRRLAGAIGQVCPLRTADGAIVVSILLGALLGAGAGGTCGRGSVPLLAAGGRGRRLAGATGQVCPFRTADGAGLVHRFRCAGRIT